MVLDIKISATSVFPAEVGAEYTKLPASSTPPSVKHSSYKYIIKICLFKKNKVNNKNINFIFYKPAIGTFL